MPRHPVLDTFYSLVQEGREGFTIEPDGREYRSSEGFAVGYKRFATPEAAVDEIAPGLLLGYWQEPDTLVDHFDLVQIFARLPTAMLAAYTRMESAIYDFAADNLIDISSFYSPGPTSTPISPTDSERECYEESTYPRIAPEPEDNA